MASAAPAPTMREHAGVVLRIGREHHGDDLSFVEEAFGKQRAHGPVDHAAGERFLFGHPPFALDVAARNLTRGVGVLAVIAGEGEKALVRFRLRRHAGADEDDRIAEPDDHAAAGLFGDLACLDRQLAAVEIDFNCLYIHLSFVAGLRSPAILFIRRATRVKHRRRDCLNYTRDEVKEGTASQTGSPQFAAPEWTTKTRCSQPGTIRLKTATASSMDPAGKISDGSKASAERLCSVPGWWS